jgi:hypothetical protein
MRAKWFRLALVACARMAAYFHISIFHRRGQCKGCRFQRSTQWDHQFRTPLRGWAERGSREFLNVRCGEPSTVPSYDTQLKAFSTNSAGVATIAFISDWGPSSFSALLIGHSS